MQRTAHTPPARRRQRRETPDHPIDDVDAVVVVDNDGTVQRVSGAAQQLLHLRSQTLTGEPFFERVHPDNLNRVLWDFAEMAGRGRHRVTWLLRLKTGLGPWQWFKLVAVNRLTRPEKPGIYLKLFERGQS